MCSQNTLLRKKCPKLRVKKMPNEFSTTVFSQIYSEPYPIGKFYETGYSVLRSMDWLDYTFKPYKQAYIHDFALIWHQYADQKLIEIAENIYVNGLFTPLQFLAIRGSSITILVSGNFKKICGNSIFKNYALKLDTLCRSIISEEIDIHIATFDRTPKRGKQPFDLSDIIPANSELVRTYLKNIDNLFQLGLKPFEPSPECDFCSTL